MVSEVEMYRFRQTLVIPCCSDLDFAYINDFGHTHPIHCAHLSTQISHFEASKVLLLFTGLHPNTPIIYLFAYLPQKNRWMFSLESILPK